MTTIAVLDVRKISLELIDPPALASREGMDEDRLLELADSIRSVGLIEPLIVKPVGARFEIVAGHRRSLACRTAGVFFPDCIVREFSDAEGERVKIRENKDRDDVNPAHEATYFAELLARYCHGDVDELVEFTGLSRGYVESRLLLLVGDDRVRAAVAAGEINISVAAELNKMRSIGGVGLYLEPARNGATARQVKQWRVDLEDYTARQAAGATGVTPSTDSAAPAPAPSGPRCCCCGEMTNVHRLNLIHVHDYCDMAILEPMLRAYRGEKNA